MKSELSFMEMSQIKFKLAKPGIFRTVQGEGALLGLPMIFVRLAGCSIGCKSCDTDYACDSEKTIQEIMREICSLMNKTGNEADWIWITGGEPTDQPNLFQLVASLQIIGRVALATSGIQAINFKPDFLSVSPHSTPESLAIKSADQINLVFGLNDCLPQFWENYDFSNFEHKYVTPINQTAGLRMSMHWAESHNGWRVGIQAHKIWGVQ